MAEPHGAGEGGWRQLLQGSSDEFSQRVETAIVVVSDIEVARLQVVREARRQGGSQV